MPTIITQSNSGLSRQALQQQAKNKKITRLFRGAYVNTDEYESLDIAGKYRIRAKAFLETHPRLRAWGITAAALEGAPVLAGAPLHFAGEHVHAKSEQDGCMFHTALPDAPEPVSRYSRIMYECASSSPLPDALLAANFLLRSVSLKTGGSLTARRNVDEQTKEVLIRQPLSSENAFVRTPGVHPMVKWNPSSDGFLEDYYSARKVAISTPSAELIWLGFLQLCAQFSSRRGTREALHMGVYCSDLAESPAESLLISRCVELGYEAPYQQVSILDPNTGALLGRVDGMWPSETVRAGLYLHDTQHGRLLFSKQEGDFASVVIEFDGRVKYKDYSPDDLEKERARQNAINNIGFRFLRIQWEDLMSPASFMRKFDAAGVPKARRRSRGRPSA